MFSLRFTMECGMPWGYRTVADGTKWPSLIRLEWERGRRHAHADMRMWLQVPDAPPQLSTSCSGMLSQAIPVDACQVMCSADACVSASAAPLTPQPGAAGACRLASHPAAATPPLNLGTTRWFAPVAAPATDTAAVVPATADCARAGHLGAHDARARSTGRDADADCGTTGAHAPPWDCCRPALACCIAPGAGNSSTHARWQATPASPGAPLVISGGFRSRRHIPTALLSPGMPPGPLVSWWMASHGGKM